MIIYREREEGFVKPADKAFIISNLTHLAISGQVRKIAKSDYSFIVLVVRPSARVEQIGSH